MGMGSKEATTVLPGRWKVTLDETPVTVQSEVLAENVPLSYAGETILAKKSSAPSCLWRYILPTMLILLRVFLASSRYLMQTAILSRANGALSQIKPTIVA